MRYGKFINEADVTVMVDGPEYTDEVLRSMGYLPIEEVGEMPSASNWELRFALSDDGTKIIQTYFVPEMPPRTFSKMKVVMALMKRNLWTQVKAFIEQAGLYDLYLAAQTFSEDNEYFTQSLSTLKTTLHVSDETVEEILSESTI